MRITLIAHSNAPWTPHYARHFLSQGHEVVLVSFCPDPVQGVRMIFVGREPYRDDRDKQLFVTRAPAVARVLRETAPDVVFAPYMISNGLTAALAWRGPLVVSARGSDLLVRTGRLPVPAPIHRRIVRFIARRATFVHAVSPELVAALIACGVPQDRIRCFPRGVDLELFRPYERQVAPETPLHMICTRRHDYVYQNHVIVQALARLRQQGHRFRFTFVGGGRLLEERRAQVDSLGLRDCVAFLPQQRHEDMPGILKAADIYVSASASDGTSSSLLEALACGVFPVLSRIVANERWVRDGETGCLFPVGDAAALAGALTRAIGDQALRQGAVGPNRKRVTQEGDQDVSNRLLLALIEDAIRARRG